MSEGTTSIILEALAKNQRGLSTQELSRLTSFNRLTLAKYLHSLEQEGLVDVKKIGMAKLWYLENCPMMKTFMSKHDSNIKLLFDSWRESIVVVDNEINIVWANASYGISIGEKLSDLMGMDYVRLHVEKHGHNPSTLEKALKTGKTERGICEERAGRQIKRSVEVTAFPVRDFNENIVGAIAIGRNITEEKMLEEELLISEQRNKFLIENFPVPIVSLDANMNVAEWNKAAEDLFGYKKDEIVGTSFEKIVPEDKKDERAKFLKNLAEQNIIKNIKTARLNKQGKRVPVNITAFGVGDEEGKLAWITGVLSPIRVNRH